MTPRTDSGLNAHVQELHGGGRPLSASTRAFFEPRYGYDFSQVRIHDDEQAARTAKSIHARAFTLGHHVVFGHGQHNPNTQAGKTLLAHELTHVIQQRRDFGHKHVNQGTGMVQRRRAGKKGRRKALPMWQRVRGQADIWMAGPLANLEVLARRVSKNRKDWMCIKPVRMKYPVEPYKDYVSFGDTFDVSNLTKRHGLGLKGNELAGAHANWATHFYGAAHFPNAPDQVITQRTNNNQPLQEMLIIAHTNNVRMGRLNVSALNANTPQPTYQRAKIGRFPNRCLFTRNARVRAVGCSSLTFGRRFAQVYLRPGSRITTTRRSVCMGVVQNRRYILRNRRTGRIVRITPLPDLYRVSFSRNWGPNCGRHPYRLTRWYTTPNSFHSSQYWSNIGGRA
jgi:hypothetical protein